MDVKNFVQLEGARWMKVEGHGEGGGESTDLLGVIGQINLRSTCRRCSQRDCTVQ